MKHYNLKYLIIGAPNTGKSALLEKLLGYRKYDSLIQLENYQYFINVLDIVVNGYIYDLQDINISTSIVISYLKDSGIIYFCYNPDNKETITFLKEWFHEYFKYIPKTSLIYLVSTKKNTVNYNINNLREMYLCLEHVSVDLDNEKEVEKLFEQAGRNLISSNENNIPGLKRIKNVKNKTRNYCLWW